jgi:hypothetical protein
MRDGGWGMRVEGGGREEGGGRRVREEEGGRRYKQLFRSPS